MSKKLKTSNIFSNSYQKTFSLSDTLVLNPEKHQRQREAVDQFLELVPQDVMDNNEFQISFNEIEGDSPKYINTDETPFENSYFLRSKSLISHESLKSIETFNFNIFAFSNNAGRGNALKHIYKYVISFSVLIHMTSEDNVNCFISKVYEGYLRSVYYHNHLHGADFCQTRFSWIVNANINRVLYLGELDLFYLYTATVIHDLGHSDQNNNYHINIGSALAITYNDRSVLERKLPLGRSL